MISRCTWAAALAAATLGMACAPAQGPDLSAGAAERLAMVDAGVALAAHCAGELEELVETDPSAAARLLVVEPALLAPHGGAARARLALRAAIAERLDSARANAAAARSLTDVADGSGWSMVFARERAERSLAQSRRLCGAADAVHDERFASGGLGSVSAAPAGPSAPDSARGVRPAPRSSP
jgi:hypothetical protein